MNASKALYFVAILFLGVSTLRNPCHDPWCSVCRLDSQHHSSSAVFPPADSVTPLMSPHMFFWEGQLQYYYLEIFLASSNILFECNGLWYFNVLVNQQFNSFKKANQVPPSQVHFILDHFSADGHISHAVRIVSPKMSHCAYLFSHPCQSLSFISQGLLPDWLLTIALQFLASGCWQVFIHHCFPEPKSHIHVLFTFTQFLIICCLKVTPESDGHTFQGFRSLV